MTPVALSLLAATMLTPANEFLRGGDVSEISEVEAQGGVYRYQGKAQDPFDLMKAAGWNFVRFRVWNEPKDGFCDKADTLRLAKRAHARGMKISIDFHYSDWWADPGKQNKPKAWKDLPFDELVKAVRAYTKDVVGALVAQGTPPVMVQVGNEIVGGMLWPDGKANSNDEAQWKRLGQLFEAGVKGVRDAEGKHRIQTMVHLDRGADNKVSVWWFDHFLKTGVDFDLIGMSYYPWWHGTLDQLKANLDDLSRRYKKDIYLVETAYPWGWDETPGEHVYNGPKTEAGYPATPEGQAKFLRKVEEIVRGVPDGRGKGILYWAPLWITTKKRHSPYQNLAVFDAEGKALPAVDVLGGRG
ncbi:MAG: glycoside hydrolase family 53 protein [Fimbriimonas sp.]